MFFSVATLSIPGTRSSPRKEATMPAKKKQPLAASRPMGRGRGTGQPKQAKQVTEQAEQCLPRVQFPIVGIGASAGGLEAFKRFFSAMPAASGMAFVLIPHLDPTHASLMVELLSRQTAMKVREAAEGMPVEPNCVYVIPPNKDLLITAGRLHLAETTEQRGLQTAIDPFFRSLAEDQRRNRSALSSPEREATEQQGLRRSSWPGAWPWHRTPRRPSSIKCHRARSMQESSIMSCHPKRCRKRSWITSGCPIGRNPQQPHRRTAPRIRSAPFY